MVDDDYEDFELLTEAIHAIDNTISVHFLDRCDDAEKFRNKEIDLVLLDINMPHHDGFFWLKSIRAEGYKLPIIMYTNSQSPQHIDQAYQEGADLYFPKPETFTLLTNGFRKLFGLDWTDPCVVKELHRKEQKYLPFSYRD